MTEPAPLTLAQATRQVLLDLGAKELAENDGFVFDADDGSSLLTEPDFMVETWRQLLTMASDAAYRDEEAKPLPPPDLAALAVVVERLGWEIKGDFRSIMFAIVNGPREIWVNPAGWSLNLNDPDFCGPDGEGIFVGAGWVHWDTTPGAYARLLALIAALSPEEGGGG